MYSFADTYQYITSVGIMQVKNSRFVSRMTLITYSVTTAGHRIYVVECVRRTSTHACDALIRIRAPAGASGCTISNHSISVESENSLDVHCTAPSPAREHARSFAGKTYGENSAELLWSLDGASRFSHASSPAGTTSLSDLHDYLAARV